MADATAQTEQCPQCKSTHIKHHSDGPYAGYWVCLHQGCSGKLAADPYFWRAAAPAVESHQEAEQMSRKEPQARVFDERKVAS